MTFDYFNTECPEELEDEVFMIETAGEMPEVALAESLADLGEIEESWRKCLEMATARTYAAMMLRDLDPANVGLSHFRGLDRAMANFYRLKSFLAKCGDEIPQGMVAELGHRLECYLLAEQQALNSGRGFASAKAGVVTDFCAVLGVKPDQYQNLISRLDALPWLDCLALMQLHNLGKAKGKYKHRRQNQTNILIEVVDEQGRPIQSTAMPILDARGERDPALMRRADTVWSLLGLPEYIPKD